MWGSYLGKFSNFLSLKLDFKVCMILDKMQEYSEFFSDLGRIQTKDRMPNVWN